MTDSFVSIDESQHNLLDLREQGMTRHPKGNFSPHQRFRFICLDGRFSNDAIWNDDSSFVESGDDGISDINLFDSSHHLHQSHEFDEISQLHFLVSHEKHSCNHITDSGFHRESNSQRDSSHQQSHLKSYHLKDRKDGEDHK